MGELTFRDVVAEDRAFLREVYGSTRESELAMLPWSDEDKQAFLDQQFNAQDRYYREQFRDAAYQVILSDGEAIGRLYLDHRPDEWRVIDIALLPRHRGQGHGTRLMRDILQSAHAAGKPVRIHVERNNPALRLYERLGFEPLESDHELYLLMECAPHGGRS